MGRAQWLSQLEVTSRSISERQFLRSDDDRSVLTRWIGRLCVAEAVQRFLVSGILAGPNDGPRSHRSNDRSAWTELTRCLGGPVAIIVAPRGRCTVGVRHDWLSVWIQLQPGRRGGNAPAEASLDVRFPTLATLQVYVP